MWQFVPRTTSGNLQHLVEAMTNIHFVLILIQRLTESRIFVLYKLLFLKSVSLIKTTKSTPPNLSLFIFFRRSEQQHISKRMASSLLKNTLYSLPLLSKQLAAVEKTIEFRHFDQKIQLLRCLIPDY